MRPEGFAVIESPSLPVEVLSALMQTVSGAPYPPRHRSLASLAPALRPASLGGTRLMAGGRMGRFLLRTAKSAQFNIRSRPAPTRCGTGGPHRYAVAHHNQTHHGRGGQRCAPRPRILRSSGGGAVTLPALRRHGTLVAMPHIGYPDPVACAALAVTFRPAPPVAGAPYFAP